MSTRQLQKHKQTITAQGKPIVAKSAMGDLFTMVESLLRTMDETGTFECGFQGEFHGGTVEMSACRHRFEMEWEDDKE